MKYFDVEQLRDLIFKPSASLLEIGKAINRTGIKMAFFLRSDGGLEGVISDGDLRRLLLSGELLSTQCERFLNRNPSILYTDQLPECINEEVTLPVVDIKTGELLGAWSEARFGSKLFENSVVIMAGGLGSRMGTLTSDCPKPMLKIDNKPILERIIAKFVDAGFVELIISINYLGEIIENYFEDGSKFGCNIQYLRESQKLGTAGSLSLARKLLNKPFILANGDVLASLNYSALPEAYSLLGSPMGMVVSTKYDLAIPYGVIATEGSEITRIEEKPIRSIDVNAGIYFFSPDVLDVVHDDEFLDAPELVNRLIKLNHKVCLLRHSGGWRDYAYPEDLSVS